VTFVTKEITLQGGFFTDADFDVDAASRSPVLEHLTLDSLQDRLSAQYQ
jgi:hypothetical protein